MFMMSNFDKGFKGQVRVLEHRDRGEQDEKPKALF